MGDMAALLAQKGVESSDAEVLLGSEQGCSYHTVLIATSARKQMKRLPFGWPRRKNNWSLSSRSWKKALVGKPRRKTVRLHTFTQSIKAKQLLRLCSQRRVSPRRSKQL